MRGQTSGFVGGCIGHAVYRTRHSYRSSELEREKYIKGLKADSIESCTEGPLNLEVEIFGLEETSRDFQLLLASSR